MRWVLVAALLAGCEGMETVIEADDGPRPGAPAPAVGMPSLQGAQVVQTWPFRNACPSQAWIEVSNADRVLDSFGLEPNQANATHPRCVVGEMLCVAAWRNNRPMALVDECAPCAPNVLPVRALACD